MHEIGPRQLAAARPLLAGEAGDLVQMDPTKCPDQGWGLEMRLVLHCAVASALPTAPAGPGGFGMHPAGGPRIYAEWIEGNQRIKPRERKTEPCRRLLLTGGLASGPLLAS